MSWRLALALVAVPFSTNAAPSVEVCSIDLASTEGAAVTVFSEDEDVRFVGLTLFGETGRFELDIVPFQNESAAVTARLIRYNRHIFHEEAGPLEERIAEVAYVRVQNGAICEGDACFLSNGTELTRDAVQKTYEDYIALFPKRYECFDRYQN